MGSPRGEWSSPLKKVKSTGGESGKEAIKGGRKEKEERESREKEKEDVAEGRAECGPS